MNGSYLIKEVWSHLRLENSFYLRCRGLWIWYLCGSSFYGKSHWNSGHLIDIPMDCTLSLRLTFSMDRILWGSHSLWTEYFWASHYYLKLTLLFVDHILYEITFFLRLAKIPWNETTRNIYSNWKLIMQFILFMTK